MKQKGQLSFDLYFAIMFALIISNQLYVASSSWGHSTDKISILNQFAVASNETSMLAQEKTIANNVTALLSGAKALGESTDFSIDYIVPRIYDVTEQGPQSCDIEISPGPANNAEILVYYPDKTAPTVTARVYARVMQPLKIQSPAGLQLGPDYEFKCGEKISIKKG